MYTHICSLAVSQMSSNAGMSRVPIPKQLLEKAHAPSVYKVSASLNISLGSAIDSSTSSSATKTAGTHTSSAQSTTAAHGVFGFIKNKNIHDIRQAFDAFQFFGNTVSSARVDLRLAKSESSPTTSGSGGDDSGAGCTGAIGGGGWKGGVTRGRETTLCRVEFEKACEVCVHSRLPLKNLNVIAELVVTVSTAEGDVDLSHDSICWTIMPLT